MQLDSKIVILLVFGVLVSLETTTAAPIVSQTDNTVDINVWPFFKMSLDKTGGTDLDIEVLSGLVRVGYERRNGQKPNVGVSVFGIGNLPGKEPEPVVEWWVSKVNKMKQSSSSSSSSSSGSVPVPSTSSGSECEGVRRSLCSRDFCLPNEKTWPRYLKETLRESRKQQRRQRRRRSTQISSAGQTSTISGGSQSHSSPGENSTPSDQSRAKSKSSNTIKDQS